MPQIKSVSLANWAVVEVFSGWPGVLFEVLFCVQAMAKKMSAGNSVFMKYVMCGWFWRVLHLSWRVIPVVYVNNECTVRRN